MYCPQCGSMVARGDVTCKKCGASLVEAREQYTAENTYRPRLVLFLKCWVHGISGGHLRWLGYNEKADLIAAKYGWKSILHAVFGFMDMGAGGGFNPFAIFRLFGSVCYLSVECISVLFGKYRTDANGYPVRWFKPKDQTSKQTNTVSKKPMSNKR